MGAVPMTDLGDKDKKDKETEIDRIRKHLESLPPELKLVDDNLEFEKQVEEKPIPPGVGKVTVFDTKNGKKYETWDINAILKGNYWRRSIYTTDKMCKLFLKASIETQKKYFKKKNIMEFQWLWLLLLIGLGIGGLVFVMIFILPGLGGVI